MAFEERFVYYLDDTTPTATIRGGWAILHDQNFQVDVLWFKFWRHFNLSFCQNRPKAASFPCVFHHLQLIAKDWTGLLDWTCRTLTPKVQLTSLEKKLKPQISPILMNPYIYFFLFQSYKLDHFLNPGVTSQVQSTSIISSIFALYNSDCTLKCRYFQAQRIIKVRTRTNLWQQMRMLREFEGNQLLC